MNAQKIENEKCTKNIQISLKYCTGDARFSALFIVVDPSFAGGRYRCTYVQLHKNERIYYNVVPARIWPQRVCAPSCGKKHTHQNQSIKNQNSYTQRSDIKTTAFIIQPPRVVPAVARGRLRLFPVRPFFVLKQS